MEAAQIDPPVGFQSNFLLGRISITQEALDVLKRLPYDLLARHALNEHGWVTRKELIRNLSSLKGTKNNCPVGGALLSRYRSDPTNTKSPWIVITTDDTWSNTLITLE